MLCICCEEVCVVLHGSMRVPCYIVYKRVLLLLLFSKSRAMPGLVECLDRGDTLSGEIIQWAGLSVHLNSSPLDGTEMMMIVSGCHCMHSFLCAIKWRRMKVHGESSSRNNFSNGWAEIKLVVRCFTYG